MENTPNVTPNICSLNVEDFFFMCLKLDNHLEQQPELKSVLVAPCMSIEACTNSTGVHKPQQHNSSLSPTPPGQQKEVCAPTLVWEQGVEKDPRLSVFPPVMMEGNDLSYWAHW